MRVIVASSYGGPEMLACCVCGHDLRTRTGHFPRSRPPLVGSGSIAPVLAAKYSRNAASDAHRLLQSRGTVGRVVRRH